MKSTKESNKSKKIGTLEKHLIIVFIMLIIGITIGYFINTENSITYSVVIALLLAEFGAIIHDAINNTNT